MNVFLWILQILFALHTAMGGIWKFTNPVQAAVPSLSALPNGLWLTLGVLDLLATVVLLVPLLNKSWGFLVPIAALYVIAEMVLFTVVHLSSGNKFNGQVVYWIVVALVAAFVAYARLSLKPL